MIDVDGQYGTVVTMRDHDGRAYVGRTGIDSNLVLRFVNTRDQD